MDHFSRKDFILIINRLCWSFYIFSSKILLAICYFEIINTRPDKIKAMWLHKQDDISEVSVDSPLHDAYADAGAVTAQVYVVVLSNN